MIYIYISKIEHPLSDNLFDRYLKLLPESYMEKNNRFIKWEDKYAHLYGKLLTIIGLSNLGLPNNCLSEIKLNKFNKPYLEGCVDFNISHSGAYVLCAVSANRRIGIDIEKIQNIELKDFEKYLTKHLWDIINHSDKPLHTFYKYWSIIESIIKAEGQGLSLPIKDITFIGNEAHYKETIWYINELNIDDNYAASIVSNSLDNQFTFEEVSFNHDRSGRKSPSQSLLLKATSKLI